MTSTRSFCRRIQGQRGISLPELTMSAGIVIMVAVLAVPNMLSATSNMRLRSSAASVSALLQDARMLAVRDDRAYTVRTAQLSGTSIAVYVDLNGNGALDPGEPLVQLGSTVRVASSGSPSTSNMNLSFTPQAATVLPSFNARGTPCVASGTACNTYISGSPVGFVYFLSDSRPLGASGWMAISVTPGGRMRVWSWDGRSWE